MRGILIRGRNPGDKIINLLGPFSLNSWFEVSFGGVRLKKNLRGKRVDAE